MTPGSIDSSVSYFKYKTLTPIRGGTTYKVLKQLKTLFQTNTSSVRLDLGDGDHGYLGIMLTDAKYAQVPSPFRLSHLFY